MLKALKSLALFALLSVFMITYFNQFNLKLNSLEAKPIIVSYNDLTDFAKEEVKCMADNIFFESAFEPIDGRYAVAMVTMNRVTSRYYPDTVCGVVKQRIRNTCQFSWWCQERERTKAINSVLTSDNHKHYNIAMQIALEVYLNYGHIEDMTQGSLFYHADYVNPNWRNVTKTTKIGRHIFYVKNENFKKGDVRNGTTYDAEIKFGAEPKQQIRPVTFVLLTDG
jgi:spore germination cell wall hydrolase CwlJ-like protein